MKDELDGFCGQVADGATVRFEDVPVGRRFLSKGTLFTKMNDLGKMFGIMNAKNEETGIQSCFYMDTMVQLCARD